MSFISKLPPDELSVFSRVLSESLRVRKHLDLFVWLQGDIQRFLPHQVMIAAWGDFSLDLIHYDVVSPLPGIRTDKLADESIMLFLRQMFDRWLEFGRVPFEFGVGDAGYCQAAPVTDCDFWSVLGDVRSVVVHGIKDQRGRHDCLYVLLDTDKASASISRISIEMLLPYLDSALRQISHLPRQHEGDELAAKALPVVMPATPDDPVLSGREQEIMHWVSLGKTNQDIGQILNISAFTVKNHLQRIFKKLNVISRAQAVATWRSPRP